MCLVFMPLIICFFNSFKSTSELVRNVVGFPREPSLSNYVYVIREKHILHYMKNSILITCFASFAFISIDVFIAYMISSNWTKRQYRILYYVFSSCMFIPSNLLVFPLVKLFYSMNLMNTYGLFIYYMVFLLPENIFVLVPYFRTFNINIRDAALLDGCNEFQFYRHMFLPICKPFILAVLILNISWVWNDFFMPLMILNKSPEKWTLPIFIYNYLGRNSSHKNLAYSSCQIALIPIVVFYTLFHRKLVKGLYMHQESK